jgi:hypothetical protein
MDASTRLEAMRIAKQVVKNAIREQGVKITSVAASDITEKAKAILAADDGSIERTAKHILKIRNESIRALLGPKET